jgi:hydrogenase maturation protease
MADVTVLGIGNILMRDDGVGVRLMEALRESRRWPDCVEFIDGGAGGLGLLTVIESARRLVVLDAAEMGLAPGRHRVIGERELAAQAAEHRLSLHDLSFPETLRLARLTGAGPEEMVILAIQPGVVDFGTILGDDVRAALPSLVEIAADLVEGMLKPSRAGGGEAVADPIGSDETR